LLSKPQLLQDAAIFGKKSDEKKVNNKYINININIKKAMAGVGFDSVFFLVTLLKFVNTGKTRPWVGPDYFIEGEYPSMRNIHGYTALEDKLYIFGGSGISGSFEATGRGGEAGDIIL
jgi:hypothetical protein